ncbi:globin-1-like [Glandiceps talaboti]
MGCGSAKVHSQELEEKPTLTKEQKDTLQNTWQNLHADLERIGMLMFMGLFEHNPEVKDFFFEDSTMKTEELRYNEKLQEHGIRVMELVEKILVTIRESGDDNMDQLVLDLGKRHVGYDVHIPYIDLFGKQFVYAIKPALHTLWNQNVEESWTTLFKYIGYLMRTGYRSQLAHVTKK